MSLPILSDFAKAAADQHRANSFYTVFLVNTATGERTYLGSTARKTGTGLMLILEKSYVQDHIATLPGMAEATFRKTATALVISNGYRIEFGGTIRQEATR